MGQRLLNSWVPVGMAVVVTHAIGNIMAGLEKLSLTGEILYSTVVTVKMTFFAPSLRMVLCLLRWAFKLIPARKPAHR